MMYPQTKEWCYITLNNEYYHEGDMVEGTIFIDIQRPLKPNTMLVLTLKGYEKYESGNENIPKKTIYQHRVTLYNWKTNVVIQKYQYKFSFSLKDPMPASFRYVNPEQNINASIQYDLRVSLHDENEIGYGSTTINIIEKNIEKQTSKEINVTSMCGLINQGRPSMEISVDQPFKFGELVQANLKLNNSACSAPINGLVAELHRILTLNRNVEHDELLASTAIAGIEGSRERRDIITLQLPKLSDKGFTSTTKGSLIESKYFIRITGQITGCMTSADGLFEVEIPIVVYEQITQKKPPGIWRDVELLFQNKIMMADCYYYDEGENLRFTLNEQNLYVLAYISLLFAIFKPRYHRLFY